MSQPSLVRSIDVPSERDRYVSSYYTLLEQFDRDVVHYGTSADRPTNPPDGYTFYDLDNNKLERWDSGTGDWIVLAGFGSASNPIDKTLYVSSIEYDSSSVNTLEATTVNADTGDFGSVTADSATVSNTLTVNGKDIDSFTDTLRTDVDSNATDVSNLQSTVSTLSSDVNSVESTVSTLETDVSNVQSTVSTLSSDVDSVESTVSTLSSDVDTAESDISTLQSDLNSLEGNAVTGQNTAWEIQKNGNDGNGIINFKTN